MLEGYIELVDLDINNNTKYSVKAILKARINKIERDLVRYNRKGLL